MALLNDPCPNCGAMNKALANYCQSCGDALVAPTVFEPRPKMEGALSPSSHGAVAVFFVVASLLLLVVGFSGADGMTAITQTAFFAASAVCGILARIAQAGWQHAKLMEELRRR